jgi:hypothetical protein
VHIFIFLKFFGLHELGSCFHVSELSWKVHMRASSSCYTTEEHKVVDVVNTASETQDVHEADAENNFMNHTGLRHTSTSVQLHMETKLENCKQASKPLSIFLTHFPLAFCPNPIPTGKKNSPVTEEEDPYPSFGSVRLVENW